MISNVYTWAIVNEQGRLLRESNGRRAIYRTRQKAQSGNKTIRGKVVQRYEVVSGDRLSANTQFDLIERFIFEEYILVK